MTYVTYISVCDKDFVLYIKDIYNSMRTKRNNLKIDKIFKETFVERICKASNKYIKMLGIDNL